MIAELSARTPQIRPEADSGMEAAVIVIRMSFSCCMGMGDSLH